MSLLSNWDEKMIRARLYQTLVHLQLAPYDHEMGKWQRYWES